MNGQITPLELPENLWEGDQKNDCVMNTSWKELEMKGGETEV